MQGSRITRNALHEELRLRSCTRVLAEDPSRIIPVDIHDTETGLEDKKPDWRTMTRSCG